MEKNIVKNVLVFCNQHFIVIVYGILSIIMEISALLFFDCEPYVKQPLFPFILWLLVLVVLISLRNKKHKAVCSYLLLLLQGILILGFNYLFLANGTVFEKSMLKQRNDAYATIEQFYINKGLLILTVGILFCYFICLKIYLKRVRIQGKQFIKYTKEQMAVLLAVNVVLVLTLCIYPLPEDSSGKSTDYQALLYKSDNSYQKKGVTGNLLYEMLHGANLSKVDITDLDSLNNEIYSVRGQTSLYNGISSGNNLVMILAESFEWYPLQIYSSKITESLYPNLSKFLKESVYCSNFYSREKTDTAEALMMLGSNPTGKYVHNDFAENTYPYSMPNLFRSQAESEGESNIAINSFHQNKGSFYNREEAHKSFGFDKLYDIDGMKEYGVENTWDLTTRERTLDSLTMGALTEEMFPENQRFFSFWITFSTHGFYNKRENLSEYYDKFDEYGVFPGGNTYQNYLRTYAAAVADFDKAIGIMMEDLEDKNLLDNTTIAIIADHNTYYNGLSGYEKKIDTQFNPELYRIPMIIYDKKLTERIDSEKGSRSITKFTTTSDVVPTLCDLLGIPIWDNLYLGSTIFNEQKESIIYSRAYNIFLSDKFMVYSVNNLKYESSDATKVMKADFKARAILHLKKLEITDKIFYGDYFVTHPYKP